ncbi:MAG TPA: hypothetical protein VHD87_16595 [Acidimicrobiales bacterium]|nr:hypothetical protein [Acidimicrobiales bacterium]
MSRLQAALGALTAGQRWTASLALALAAVVVLFGAPQGAAPVAAAPVAAPRRAAPTATTDVTLPAADASLAPDLVLAPPALDEFIPAAEDTPVPTAEPADPPPPPPGGASPLCVAPYPLRLTGVARLDVVLCTVFTLIPVTIP